MYSLPPGRPQTSFDLLSNRRKRERVAGLRNTSAEELVFAAQMNFRATGHKQTAEFLEESLSPPPNTPKSSTTMLTPGQALSLLIEARLSHDQYDIIRKYAPDVLPSYKVVQKEKSKCYPTNLIVSEQTAEVPIQNLLDHTVERLSASQKDVLNSASCNELTLYSKVGIDGSSGHSEYHQRFANQTDVDDKFVFITCLVPIKLSNNTNVFSKNCVEQNKIRIQEAFEKELGLKIDRPKPGYGNTNTGNVA